MKRVLIILIILAAGIGVDAREYHVTKTGHDNNAGAFQMPLLTIQAAPGEDVSIRGSKPVGKWIRQKENAWMAALDNSYFGDYNPCNINLSGNWLDYEHYHNNIFIGNQLDGMTGDQTGNRFNHNLFLEGARLFRKFH